ncbi:MAG: CHAT domain-containing protein [Candidatus Aminicenantes bacterium]|jgi:hypothetical protein
MNQKYYTIRIRIANIDNIHLDIYDANNQLIMEPSGRFGFKDNVRDRISELHEKARGNDPDEARVEELGKLLFSALFDEGLRREFLDIYQKAQQENALLRLELDVDERQLPEVAALPWEFMYVSPGELHGALWLATAPNMVFSRQRARWHVPEPIQLKIGERLRIAIAAAAPKDLGPVQYQKICNELKKMARTERFEVLEVLEVANRSSIDALLEKKPHIFHFIGHGSLKDENRQDTGLVALVDSFGSTDLVSADYFSELFNRFKPGLVVLHTCESGALSSSKAFVGIASRVVQMNVPAVAAMQFKVSNATAQRFALEFYRRLAENEPVDKAVQEARRHIALNPPSYGSRDFATPILFMSIREGRLFQRQTDIPDKSEVISELVENAGRMEENASFNEAIKTWKDIRDLEPEHPEIEQALNRLEMKSKNQAFIRELLEKLSSKKEELGWQVYLQVSIKLKRIGKQGINDEDEVYIELVRDLIAKKMTASEFSKCWEEDVERPQREKEPNYEILAERLHRGEIIPFLGLDLLHLSGLPVPSCKEMAQYMAGKVKYTNFNGTLSMISQYYQMEGYSRGMVMDTVKELVEKEKEPGSHNQLYELLSGITKPFLVISTSYDNLLETIFQEKGKRFVVISHHIQSSSVGGLGKLLLKYSHKQEPETPCTSEAISGLKLLEDGYSIIYKICGCFGQYEDNPMMILETDFFAFSRHLEQLIPAYITRQFPGRGFLFLGYNLEEWQNRLIANALLEKRTHRDDSSFAAWENPTPYERAFWKSHQVDLYDLELTGFVKRLHESMKRLNNGT